MMAIEKMKMKKMKRSVEGSGVKREKLVNVSTIKGEMKLNISYIARIIENKKNKKNKIIR